MIILETKRLILRTFKDEDLDPMAQINQDPKVMEYFPAVGDKEQTRIHIKRINDHYDKYGFSLYAVEIKNTGEFIGFVGLLHRELDEFDASFMPATEIGWRLSSKHWGKGYAPEASKAVLEYAFNTLNLKEVVSFTSVGNQKSIRVMNKIGLKHDPKNNFYHPKLDKDHPLALHVLYKLSKEDFLVLSENNYHLRKAVAEDAQELTKLSVRSKKYWGYPKSLIDAWMPELEVTADLIEQCISYAIEKNGQIKGFWCRMPTEELSDGRLFVDPDCIGTGLGKVL